MLKLLAADFDGTLMPYGQKSVSNEIINKIKGFVNDGMHFAVASGRTYSELKALLGEVSDKIYFVANDGALIVKNEKVVFKRPFDKSSVKQIIEDENLIAAAFYSLDSVYKYKKSDFPFLGKTPKVVERAFQVTEDIFKITASVNNRAFSDCENYRVHYQGEGYAELVQPYANKGMALSYLQLHLSVSKFETAALGDANNDVPMMKNACESFCIGEKSVALTKTCKYKCNNVISAFKIIDELNQHQNHTKQHQNTRFFEKNTK